MKDLIDIPDLSVEDIYDLMDTAIDMEKNPAKYSDCCRGKILATLFYEPSTRTRLSFESAMLRLGGGVIGFSGASGSSASKGESVHDTAIVVAQSADIIAMRHNKEGAPLVAARSCDIPVVNAGDGGHCHPTQTLADLLTIYKEKGTLENLTVGMCGDLKYGRTVHSLLQALARYSGLKVVLISPKELEVPQWVIDDVLVKNDIPYSVTEDLESTLKDLDVLYMTRIQKERFDSPEVYERLKDVYQLTKEKMEKAAEDCIVLHPLPRVNEISVQVDSDPRACYFKQVKNGRLMRMALIRRMLLEGKEKREDDSDLLVNKFICDNPRCITSEEQEAVHLFHKVTHGHETVYRCVYCEKEIQG